MKQIQSVDEYYQIYEVWEQARDRLISGQGEVGVHYNLSWILRSYGVFTNGREDVVKQGKLLLDKYEKENFQ